MEETPFRFVDVSHRVEAGMVTYPGLPGPVIQDHMSREASEDHYENGTTFQIGRIEMVANTGTYLDSPFHRFAEGKDLSELHLSRLANLDGRVFRTDPGVRAIGSEIFEKADLSGKAVLIHTGWDVHWGTDRYHSGHPFLTGDAADYIESANAALVGIDSLNIDDTADGRRPVHSTLLESGIPVVEHLCRLGRLPDSGFRFFAVPVKVKGFGSFPVRAFAIIRGEDSVVA